MMEVTIGIDQSLTKTGIAVVEKESLNLLEYGTVQSKDKGIPRLNELASDIIDTVKEYSADGYKIYCVGLEQYAFNKKFGGGRVFDLAELGGILKREIFNSGHRIEIITVQEHVKDLTGSASKLGDKLPRIHTVNALYNLELRAGKTKATQDSDIADAISIARYIAKYK